MTKWTNKLNLPDPVVRAVTNDDWSRGPGADASVTELLSPIRQTALKTSGQFGEMTLDVADQIFALFGKVGHGVLEKAGGDVFQEEQLMMKLGDYTLSGRMDSLFMDHHTDDTWEIQDYKFTSVYVAKAAKEKDKGRIDEWFTQLNLYRMLAEANGFPIGKLTLVLLLRDWSKLAVLRDPDMPKHQVLKVDCPLMDMDMLQKWARNRMERMLEAQQGLDQYGQTHLPLCDSEERWDRPTKYAVKKKGVKKALKLENSEEEAFDWASKKGHTVPVDSDNPKGDHTLRTGLFIEHRIDESIRCEHYCDVSEWCQQFKDSKASIVAVEEIIKTDPS